MSKQSMKIRRDARRLAALSILLSGTVAGAQSGMVNATPYEASGCDAICKGTWKRPAAKTLPVETRIQNYMKFCANVCKQACNEGDVETKVIAPFVIYGALNPEQPIGAVSEGGTVCIDNNLNLNVPPAADQTWVYYKQGLRSYEGKAPLSAFQGIAAAPELSEDARDDAERHEAYEDPPERR